MSTRYVSPTGSNSSPSGSIDAPWLTISYAVAQLFAGDNLLIRAGTYTGSLNALISASTTIRGGTSWSNAITIAAYPGETVTIANTGTANLIAFTSATQQYIILADLILDASLLGNEAGVVYLGPDSHHIRMQDCDCFGAGGYAGVATAETNAGDNEFLRLRVHDCGEHNTPVGHGFYISSPRNLIEGCESYNNYGWGIQLFAGNTDGNIVRQNWVHDNAFGVGSGGGIVAAAGPTSSLGGVKVYNNIISGTHPDGYGIQVGVAGSSTCLNFEILNNTILAADAVIIENSATGTLLKNNILRTVNNAGAGSVVNNGTGTVQTTNFTSDPSFTNGGGSYALASDFQLEAGSGAIDTGTTVASVPDDYTGGTRPAGAAYDIGAYEFGSTPGEEEDDEPPPTTHQVICGLRVSGTADAATPSVLLTGETAYFSTTRAQVIPPGCAGTFRNWTVRLSPALGVGNTRTVTVYKGTGAHGTAVATGLTVTFGATDTLKSITGVDVHFNAGDSIEWRDSFTGTNVSAILVQYSIEFEPDTPGLTLYGFHGGNVDPGEAIPPFMGGGTFQTAGRSAKQINRIAQTVLGMTVRVNAAPGAGTSWELVWDKNGVVQDGAGGTTDTRLVLSGTAVDASITYGTPLTLADGDEVQVLIRTVSGAPAYPNRLSGAIACAPTTSGHYQFHSQGAGMILTVGGVEYMVPGASACSTLAWGATEAPLEFIGNVGSDILITGMYVDLQTALTLATQAVTFRLRVNGAPVGSALILSGIGAITNSVTFPDAVTVTAGDTWSVQATVSGSDGLAASHGTPRLVLIPGQPPPAPTVETLTATNVRSGSATLRGRIDPNGTAMSGQFRWWLCAESPPMYTYTALQSVGSGSQPVTFTAELTDLEPDTTYCFQAIGDDGGSPDLFGAIRSFTTSGEALFIDGTVSHPLTWMEMYVDDGDLL